jgi:hypothetical protein
MRKFVVKNRQKRKYVKKNEKESLYSFSKTTYGMLPVLITAIAFMATLIISAPFRNYLLNLKFTFQIPQFSLSNPFHFFQTTVSDISEFFSLLSLFTIAISTTVIYFISNLLAGIIHIGTSFNYRPILTFSIDGLITIGNFFSAGFLYAGQGILIGFKTIIEIYTAIFSIINIINMSFNTFIVNLFLFVGQSIVSILETLGQAIIKIINTSLLLGQLIIQMIVTVFHVIVTVTIFTSRIILSVAYAIITWVDFIFEAIFNFIGRVIIDIVHVIEIPFKILANFFAILKPYFDILGKHIKMVGGDFTNGFVSIGKVSADLSPQK